MTPLPAQDSPTILVVDDDAALRQVIADCLVDDGYHVLTASSGEEALQQVATTAPALVVLDVMMPGLDGFETLTHLQAQGYATPVVLMSAGAPLAREKAVAAAVPFLAKPFDLDALVQAVARCLDGVTTPTAADATAAG